MNYFYFCGKQASVSIFLLIHLWGSLEKPSGEIILHTSFVTFEGHHAASIFS